MGDEGGLERRLQVVDRSKNLLRPVVVERLIDEDHPARAIWEFVGRLDLTRFVEQVRSVEGEAGRPIQAARVSSPVSVRAVESS